MSAYGQILDRFYVISMEFLLLSCRHFSLRNIPCSEEWVFSQAVIAVVQKILFYNYQHLLIVFTTVLPLPILSTHHYCHTSQIIITLNIRDGSFFLSKSNCIYSAVICYHTHFLLTVITHVEGSNGGTRDLCITGYPSV